MSSSSGISWRQGPHQLAQKLIMTTWPLYLARSSWPPAFAGSTNSGAGPVGSAATAGRAMTRAATIPAIRFFMGPPANPLKEDGRADTHLDVVGELRGAQEVGLKHAILHCDVDREPVRWQHPVACPEIHRELLVAGEIDTADTAEEIKSTGQGESTTDKGLAREEVVAE